MKGFLGQARSLPERLLFGAQPARPGADLAQARLGHREGTTRAGANHANFLVARSTPGFFNYWQPNRAALAALGRPVRTYHVGPYTVYVYDKNLLAELPHH